MQNMQKNWQNIQNSQTEIKDQWKMDTDATIPVTLSTNGIIPETLHKALNTLSLHPNTFIEFQKSYDSKYMQYSEKVFQHLIKQHTYAITLTLS
jgi:hypothetical protein